jgi:hypothetical protein
VLIMPDDREMEPAPIIVPDNPNMPKAAVAVLKARLADARCYLEYGSGGSTVLAARTGVPRVYSVESDSTFFAAVEQKVLDLGGAVALRPVLVDIGPTRRWSRPIDNTRADAWPNYSAQVWEVIEQAGDTPDTILIDGRFRVACCLQSFLRMSDDAVILFDDYFDREDLYDIVTRFADIDARHARVAVFRKPKSCDWAALRQAYLDYARDPA